MSTAARLQQWGFPAVLLRHLLREVHTVQTVLEILVINTKEGTAKKTGNAYKISEAHCVLRNQDGTAGAVGVLTIPKKLEEVAKQGWFTAGFTLAAPTYGPDQGKVVAELASLIPIKPEQLQRKAA